WRVVLRVPPAVAPEDVVGADVQQDGLGGVRRGGGVARADHVRPPARLPVALGAGDVGVGRGVDDHVRPEAAGDAGERRGVRHVQQRADGRQQLDALAAAQQGDQLPAEATVPAGEQDPHAAPGSLTAALRKTKSVAARPPTKKAATTVTLMLRGSGSRGTEAGIATLTAPA